MTKKEIEEKLSKSFINESIYQFSEGSTVNPSFDDIKAMVEHKDIKYMVSDGRIFEKYIDAFEYQIGLRRGEFSSQQEYEKTIALVNEHKYN